MVSIDFDDVRLCESSVEVRVYPSICLRKLTSYFDKEELRLLPPLPVNVFPAGRVAGAMRISGQRGSFSANFQFSKKRRSAIICLCCCYDIFSLSALLPPPAPTHVTSSYAKNNKSPVHFSEYDNLTKVFFNVVSCVRNKNLQDPVYTTHLNVDYHDTSIL